MNGNGSLIKTFRDDKLQKNMASDLFCGLPDLAFKPERQTLMDMLSIAAYWYVITMPQAIFCASAG
ncbi:MAG: hypothetical protein ABII27_00675 [bacterium]